MMEAAALARVGVERLICGDDRRCAGRTQRTSRNDARACMHGIQLMLALALIALLGAPAAAAACTADADCDDGLFCDGAETCQSGACVAATAVDCSTAADQCNDAACSEISRSCVRTPKIDGFVCDDGNACTATDVCQSGVCVGSDGADSDGDGYCDRDEIQAQCNPNDPQEIPPQANVYQGGRVGTRGDVLMTFLTPGDLKVSVATNPSCATAGLCNQATHFCTAGAVADPCSSNADCNMPANTCRVVINYAAIPSLSLSSVIMRQARRPVTTLSDPFLPATPGCSRKVDVALPATFKRVILRLKAAGLLNGHKRIDRDRFVFQP